MIGLAARGIILVAGLALPNVSIASSELAAPWIILIEDEKTNQRIALTDWLENHRLMLSLGKPIETRLNQTPASTGLRVAMFWGPNWKDWQEKGIDLSTLSFGAANQHARLFRATDVEPAYWQSEPFTLRPQMKVIDSPGVRILESHGVNVRHLSQ